MEENYLNHEVDQVIEMLKGYFSLQGLKNSFDRENYLAKDAFEVETSHQYLEEFSRFLHDGHEIAIPSLLDMDPIFAGLEKQSVLSVAELGSIMDLLSSSEYIYDILYDKKEYYHLNDDALDLNPLTQLKRDLSFCIQDDMTIADHATPKLAELRSAIRDRRKQLSNIMNTYKNRYNMYLESNSIALKGDQEVLAVKTANKGYVKGSVISYSSTGETVFMVPYEVLEIRNKLTSLVSEEQTEVMKILADLSSKAGKQLKYLKRDYEIISVFDRYLGSLRFGNSYNGCIATQSEDELSLIGLFHPLLKAKKVVSNSITLGGKDEPKVLLITGPNAGGKSIFIKATALACMMDKLGLLVPCLDSAKVPFMDDVFFLGGDNQSVMDNLSTFSSHLLGIKNITLKASPKSLVIIDEVGEGTSPKDGEAIGVGLLKFFERKGCFTMMTSHFDGLKIYAAGDPKCLTGAMEFNTTGLKPTYRLLLHTTGKSYGILLARQMGLDESILDDAVAFQKERSDKDTDALMEKLTEQVAQNEKKARELDNAKKDLERLADKRQKAIDSLNDEKNSIKMKAESKINRLVEERLEEINRIWKENENKKGGMSYSEVSQKKGELKKIAESGPVGSQTSPKKEMLKEIKLGEILEDEDHRKGKVVEVKKNEVLLDMDGLRIRRKIDGLKRARLTASDVKAKKEHTAGIDSAILNVGPSQGLELNIIGQHVDEAMRNVVSFLDSSRIRKFSYVRIIHGTGTFALKNAVWKYLQNHKDFVKDYRLGGEGEGGLGATIVHLK